VVDDLANVLGSAVEAELRGEPELGGDDDVVSEPLDGPAEDLLALTPAVELRGVEQRDAKIVGLADRSNALLFVAGPVGHRDAHRAVADGGGDEALLTEGSLLHAGVLSTVMALYDRCGSSCHKRLDML